MREILFRGKSREDNNEWVEGGICYDGYRAYVVKIQRYTPDTRDWDIADYYERNPHYISNIIEVDPETVGQYTGFTDKNGKKIFEGDIVKASWGYKGLVEYDSFMYAKLECTISDDIEVIGNVHDNPEMLSVVEVMKYQEGK